MHSFVWWRTPAWSHTYLHGDTVSIAQYFRCQSCVSCHAPPLPPHPQWRRLAAEDRGTLPDKPAAPFNTCALPVISSYVSVWVPGLSWHSQQTAPPSPPRCHRCSRPSLSPHKEGWSDRTSRFTSPVRFLLPLPSLDDPPRAPEYWPELSPRPAPLTPLCGAGSMAGLKVQMIFLHHPPSCLPSELIANDNIREEHNGDSTNNLPLRMKLLEFCDIIVA